MKGLRVIVVLPTISYGKRFLALLEGALALIYQQTQ